jgi:hypothetical protein
VVNDGQTLVKDDVISRVYSIPKLRISTENSICMDWCRANTQFSHGDGIERNSWEDEDFLKPFEAQGKKIAVHEEDTLTIKLVARAVKEMDKN